MNHEIHKYLLEEMNALEVKDKISEKTIAILIIGACENHGDHMPFGADFIFPFHMMNYILKDICKRKDNVILIPYIPFGVSLHHKEFQMTISLEPSTMISLISNILYSLIRNNIKKILVINGHDGNIAPIEIAARLVKDNNPDVIIACLESWWVLVGQKYEKLFDIWDGLGHGGEAETSAMMAVRPDLVKSNNSLDTIIPNLPSNEIRIFWKFDELSKMGYTGAPKSASKEKGIKIIELLKTVILSFIDKMESNEWKYGVYTSKKLS